MNHSQKLHLTFWRTVAAHTVKRYEAALMKYEKMCMQSLVNLWSCAILILISLEPFSLRLKTRAKASANVTKLKPVYNFGRNFLGLDKCNACIGTSLCRKFFKEEIRFENWLSAGLKLPPSHKTTYFANYTADTENWKPVIISRLQSKFQDELSDWKICTSASKKATCSIENVLRNTERFQKWLAADRLTADLVQSLPSPLLRCPSQRLLDRIVRRYAEVRDSGSVLMRQFTDRDKLRLLYTLSVNTHPIVLQLFPGIEGWPFLRYFGSCGRVIVTPWTNSIREFYNASLEVIVDIAYQLLQITHSMKNNDLNYFFYYTSVHDNMFGTFEDGRLYITDTSTIGIIDQQEDKGFVHEINWKKDVFSCLASNCEMELTPCEKISEAQNFIKVCKDLLPNLLTDKFGSSPALQKQINTFLRLCSDKLLSANVTLQAADQLMELLKSHQSCDPHFEYRYPECKYSKGY
ncbi:divergent protein kinase domain 2B [Hemiscyllium ocellatum]|uniref:divergent protein kinase domain 2B n=1 Tax=Hemiscyllium ocellatum TaxID=170820 RepID=UPI0029668260|nr:divergent protein kinase domain 2B [Hemiscyllium ocellatum]